VTVNSKEENCSDVCLDFVQEFGLRSHHQGVQHSNYAVHSMVMDDISDNPEGRDLC
jgi:hypothetical protein